MTDIQHTPGPWKVGYRAMDVMADYARPKGPMKVCDIRGWGFLTGKGHGALGLSFEEAVEIQEANARLIAAAPDMLATHIENARILRLLVNELQGRIDGGKLAALAGCLERSDAAIAKATGRANLGDDQHG